MAYAWVGGDFPAFVSLVRVGFNKWDLGSFGGEAYDFVDVVFGLGGGDPAVFLEEFSA